MTLTQKKVFLSIGAISSTLLLAASIVLVTYIWNQDLEPLNIHINASQQWWGITRIMETPNLHWRLVAMTIVVFVSSLGSVLLRLLFRKTISSEMFFFAVFVNILCLESLRILHVFFMVTNQSHYWGLLITRVIYFSRTYGLFMLLASSIYAHDIKTHNFSTILGAAFIAAFSIAYLMPFDSTNIFSSFLYKLGDERGLAILIIMLEILIAVNFFRATVEKGISDYLFLGISITLVILGIEFFFFYHSLSMFILGMILLITGSAIFIRKHYTIYFFQ